MHEPAKQLSFAAAVTCLLFALQAGIAWLMYERTAGVVAQGLSEQVASAAGAAAAVLNIPGSALAETDKISDALRSIRLSHRLEMAVILDRDGHVIAGAEDFPEAGRPSVFDISPAHVATVFETGAPGSQSVTILGDVYRRMYYPLMQGETVRGVLCFAAFDPTPARILALQGAFLSAIVISLCAAVVLGFVVLAFLRLSGRARSDLVKAERLATAGTLAASIAHDLKTPLATIISSAQLLQNNYNLDEGATELLRNIEDEARRSSDQVENFLDLTREMPARLREEDLAALTRETTALFAAKIRETGVDFSTDLPPGPVPAMIDRRKYRRALTNLVINAFEALGSRPASRITVSACPAADDQAMFEIRVEDNGPGIPDAVMKRIVEPFFTTKQEGTGLGLALVRQITEQHGGSVRLRSCVGGGTTVTMLFPVLKKAPDANPDRRG